MVGSPEKVLGTAKAKAEGYGIGQMSILYSGSSDTRILVCGSDQLRKDFELAFNHLGLEDITVYFSSNKPGTEELLKEDPNIGLFVYHPQERRTLSINPEVFASHYSGNKNIRAIKKTSVNRVTLKNPQDVLIYGVPGQTKEDFIGSINLSEEDKKAGAKVYFCTDRDEAVELLQSKPIGVFVYHPDQKRTLSIADPVLFAQGNSRNKEIGVLEAELLSPGYSSGANYSPDMVADYQRRFESNLAYDLIVNVEDCRRRFESDLEYDSLVSGVKSIEDLSKKKED